jgi:hypothetical protein
MPSPTLKRIATYVAIGALGAGAALFAVHARAAGVPDADGMTYSGYLEDGDGAPLSGDHSVSVTFFESKTATKVLCTATNADDPSLQSGRFQLALPAECTDTVKASPDVWVEVMVDGGPLGRTKLGVVPYALEAGHATETDHAAEADHAPLSCQLREGENSKGTLFASGSSAACMADEVLTGGGCTAYSGKGGSATLMDATSVKCKLSDATADANDYVRAQAICCKK